MRVVEVTYKCLVCVLKVENGGGSVTKIGKLDVFGFPADNLQVG